MNLFLFLSVRNACICVEGIHRPSHFFMVFLFHHQHVLHHSELIFHHLIV
jgi:hypothetical protein